MTNLKLYISMNLQEKCVWSTWRIIIFTPCINTKYNKTTNFSMTNLKLYISMNLQEKWVLSKLAWRIIIFTPCINTKYDKTTNFSMTNLKLYISMNLQEKCVWSKLAWRIIIFTPCINTKYEILEPVPKKKKTFFRERRLPKFSKFRLISVALKILLLLHRKKKERKKIYETHKSGALPRTEDRLRLDRG